MFQTVIPQDGITSKLPFGSRSEDLDVDPKEKLIRLVKQAIDAALWAWYRGEDEEKHVFAVRMHCCGSWPKGIRTHRQELQL